MNARGRFVFANPGTRARIFPLWLQPAAWAGVAAAGFAIAVAASALFFVIGAATGHPQSAERWPFVIGISLFWLVLSALTVVVWVRLVERRPLASMGIPALRSRGLPRRLAQGLVWSVLGIVLVVAMQGETVDLRSVWSTVTTRPLGAVVALAIATPLIAAAALAEEVMFRGWLLSTLSARAGVGAAVLISSVLFAALHVYPTSWLEPAAALSTIQYVVLAASLCFIALRDGHLFGAAAFHTGINTAGLYIVLLENDLDPQAIAQLLLASRAYDAVMPAAAAAAFQMILLLALYRLWRRHEGGGEAVRRAA